MKQVPPSAQTQETAVMHLLEAHRYLLPSARLLSEEMIEMITYFFILEQTLHIAEFIQAEALPFNVLCLQHSVNSSNVSYYNAYLFASIGIMSGLGGGPGGKYLLGSSFMTEKRTRALLIGIETLREFKRGSPEGVYWGYICVRSRHLGSRVSVCCRRPRTSSRMARAPPKPSFLSTPRPSASPSPSCGALRAAVRLRSRR